LRCSSLIESASTSRGLVQVDDAARRVLPAEQGAPSRDHHGSALGVTNGAPRRLDRTLDVRRRGRQHPQTRVGVHDDGRERLIDLVRDRGGQRGEARDARHVRELRADFVARLLGEPLLGDVAHRADVLPASAAVPTLAPVRAQVLDRALGHP
jgi:hypothetical protein